MQMLFFALFILLGAILCAVFAVTLTRRWRLPWRDALMYFGLAPYPHEVALPPRRRPAQPARRRAPARRRPVHR